MSDDITVVVDEVIVVFGRGLEHAIERGTEDGREWVRYKDHGNTGNLGMWAWTDETRLLTKTEATAALKRERIEARARAVECRSIDCWCVRYQRYALFDKVPE